MIVVSDTSPITNLALVGHLDILQQLYGSIVIPQAIAQEIAAVAARLTDAPGILTLDWIHTRQITDQVLIASLELELDPGEAEAIALTIELQADLLLLDERRGRVVALRLGLKFVGLLGTLIEAKQHGLVPAVKPVLDDLMTKAGFWISRELYDRVVQAAGE
jgi:predicted nucleic acid-binding protein